MGSMFNTENLEEDQPPMAAYLVTCETPTCENVGVTLEVSATAENPLVMCGPCGNPLDPIPAAPPVEG